MKIYPVTDPAFNKYGRIISDIDLSELMKAMENTPQPDNVVYVGSVPELEALDVYEVIKNKVYGGMPIQIGYCNGDNHVMAGAEYHRDSELNMACTDAILTLGMEQDIDRTNYTYDTSKIEAFRVPKGTMVEMYGTTLHLAPISAGGKFRVVVVLPRGTNEKLTFDPGKEGENKLLTDVNKWLIAHPDSDMKFAHPGFIGEMPRIDE